MRCFDLMALPSDASLEQVRSRWRALAALHHPDKGGDVAVFQELSEAYERACKIASEAPIPPTCIKCSDTGTVAIYSGFERVVMACPKCKVA